MSTPDYIASSLRLTDALKAQGITIEVDEFAPKVWCYAIMESPECYSIGNCPPRSDADFICPYFGPGGADNSMKALVAWCLKNRFFLQRRETFCPIPEEAPSPQVCWDVITPYSENTKATRFATGKAPEGKDGIALHALLEKLLEEKP